jgi:hypothetical protein
MEHFVCIPRRLLNGTDAFGYRLAGHKRPSALDHAQTPDATPFVGRDAELARLDDAYRQSRRSACTLALIARPGAGKTRLINEWRRRRPELRVATGRFSLFGGDVVTLASQVAELPADRLDANALAAAIMRHIDEHEVDVVIVDDMHWADPGGIALLRRLLAELSSRRILVLLVSRPAGIDAIEQAAGPTPMLYLAPLGVPAIAELAERLIPSAVVAEIAVSRSQGNPLFVEQFAAWALETGYRGGGEAPSSLHQIIAARIGYLSQVRVETLRQKLRWGAGWQRQKAARELERIESEIGLWLDRLETGDCADRIDAAGYLLDLERLDFDLFILRTLAGEPRLRSSRLREAIERLLVGSGEAFLAALVERGQEANDATRENVHNQAMRAGDCARDAFDWSLAARLYALAQETAPPWRQSEAQHRLVECRRHLEPPSEDLPRTDTSITSELEANPAVDLLALPEALARLGEATGCRKYYRQGAAAAEAIGDHGFAMWARQRASGQR